VAAYLVGTLLSLAAILMEEVGYRQLAVWFRLKAFVRCFQGDHSWGRMKREGSGPAPAAAAGMRPAA
jgi:hypothetical protein